MRLVKWHYLAGLYGYLLLAPYGLLCSLFWLVVRQLRVSLLITTLLLHSQTAFYLPAVIVPRLDNQVITLRGKIVSVPQHNSRRSHFLLKTSRVNDHAYQFLISLSDYKRQHHYQLGQQLMVDAKLKIFRNFANPGSRRYTQQQYGNHIYMRGYIKRLTSQHKGRSLDLALFRQQISALIHSRFSDPLIASFIARLLVGEKSSLAEMGLAFRKTGTSHLMAISGLHVGMVAGLFFMLGRCCWQCSTRLMLYYPAQQAAAVLSLVAVWSYGLLAGMPLSTQRACIMVSLWMIGEIMRCYVSHWQRFWWAMFLVCWLNPWAIYGLGFYLSFYVVFLLLWFHQSGKVSLVAMQWRLWVMLLPLSLASWGSVSLSSVPANLFAIPLVSFCLLPLCFAWLGSVVLFPSLAALCQSLLVLGITILFKVITYLSQIPWTQLSWPQPSLGIVLASSFVLFYALTLPQRRDRWVLCSLATLLLCVPLLKSRPATGQAYVAVLDVGQGLAVFVQTRHHSLLYDCGSGGEGQLDMGKLVLLPFLGKQGVRHLDTVVISHQDSDHRGGFTSLSAQLSVTRLITNRTGIEDCQHQQHWQWDGLDFTVLGRRGSGSENQRSCVLQIANAHQQLLLPGDIDTRVEKTLLRRYGRQLASTYLLVPHHGSKTSSSKAFIQAVKPDYAVISAGYHNRYRLPNQLVVKRYHDQGSHVFNTASCGMASWYLRDTVLPDPVRCYRKPYDWG